MLTKELLERYMKQNPKKYMAKFGGKTHEQILEEERIRLEKLAGLPSNNAPKPEVKVEMSKVEQVETTFAPQVDTETAQIQEVAKERIIKRGRKPNAE